MPLDDSGYFGKRREELKPYLKCLVGEGMHDREYFVSFNTTKSSSEENPLIENREGETVINISGLENRMFVDKEDVIEVDDERNGLLEIQEIYDRGSKRSLVGINDLGDMRVSRIYVLNSDIVWR